MKIYYILFIFCCFAQIAFSQEEIYISTYSPSKLYFYNTQTLQLQEIPEDTALVGGNNYIIIDTIHQRILQAYHRFDNSTFAISSAYLDGSDLQILKFDSSFTADLAIDYKDNKLLWLDNTNGKIMRADLNGNNVEVVLD